MIQHSNRSTDSSGDNLALYGGKTGKMSLPSLWLSTRLRGHPWSICRGCKPRRAASSRDSWSRCLTRRGGRGTFGMGWGWRWLRTAARWSCIASHTWTQTCRCWRWGGREGEANEGPVHDAEFCCCCCCDRENVRLALEPKLGRFRAVIRDWYLLITFKSRFH